MPIENRKLVVCCFQVVQKKEIGLKCVNFDNISAQPAFSSSKITKATLKQGLKYIQT